MPTDADSTREGKKTKLSYTEENCSSSIELEEQDKAEEFCIDPAVERRAVRKLDLNVLPILCLFYFFAALDRSNIGNAGSSGLIEDIPLTEAQFSNAVTLFFITYIIFELPGTMLLRVLRPSRLLSVGVCGWSLVCIGMTFVKSYWSILFCRLLLGVFESIFFPCLVVYISGIAGYNKDEQGTRVAILLCCAAFSGAIGGLISYGFVQVNTPTLEGFRFIFLIEGIITIVCVPLLIFWLPDDPINAKFFNDEEKKVMLYRKKQREEFMGDNKFHWEDVKIALLDIRTYFSMVIQFCADVVLYGFSTFLPSILKTGLGYDSLKAQYLTIPVYFFSALAVLSVALYSDRKTLRGPFILAANIVGIIGYAILLGASNNSAKYFATFLIAVPLYIGATLNLAWTSNNTAPYYRKTFTIGCNQTIGNLSGAIAGQVYRKSPFRLGHAFSLGSLGVSSILVVLNMLRLKQLNTQKEQIQAGDKDDHKKDRTGDQKLDFRYTY